MVTPIFSLNRTLFLFSLIYVVSSETTIMHDSCKGLGQVDFNATGSVKQNAFFPASNTSDEIDQWTWHVGLYQDPPNNGTAQQTLWVDTTGSTNLNDPNLDYDLCLQIFWDLPEEAFANATENDGSCSALVGDECLDALRRDAVMEWSGEGACAVFTTVPMECNSKLQSSTSGAVTRRNARQNNQECGSTTDNPTGEHSIYQTWLLNEEDKSLRPGKDLYDVVAKNVPLVAAMALDRTGNRGNSAELEIFCLRNTDFADGSRKPTATETPRTSSGAPTPTNSGTPSTSPSSAAVVMQASGWGWALVMGAVFYSS